MPRLENSNVKKTCLAPPNTEPLRHMFDHSAVGVARVAPDGQFLVVNLALCRMLGYSRSDLLRKTAREITHPNDRARDTELLKTIFCGGETSYRIDKRYLCRSGLPLWVIETSSAVEGGDGSILYRVSVVQINERKQAAEQFRLALEAATSAMVMQNQEGKIVLVNSRAERLFGYTREELLGKPVSKLLTKPPKKDHQGVFENQAKGDRWGSQGRCKNGTHFPVKLGLHPVHTLQGTWILSSIEDITLRKRPGNNRPQATVTIPILRSPSVINNANNSRRTMSG